MKTVYYIFLVWLITLTSCGQGDIASDAKTLFVSKKSQETGISFVNQLTETEEVNYFTYPYIYMGGGVAIGDINNDGLQDLFFTANMEQNRLYLNEGNMQFKDISLAAGVGGDERWCTGVTMADVNGDGWLDIYVSVSGKWATTENLLYINNGDLTFTESAQSVGLADNGQSTQATFFDYDLDGDLDVYVANYPPLRFDTPNFVYRRNIDLATLNKSDHLYNNDGGIFTDVTEKAGVLNFGLSLSATSGDFNQDGYPDLYVSNDFASPDQFYFNNGDGTFTEKVRETTQHTAFYGMGVDIADFNNDQLLDIFQADMTPEDNFRSKANMASMNTASFAEMIDKDLHYQYMENAFQVNHGIGDDGLPRFGDISRMVGASTTDWSWSPLFADFDNDGWKDLHITNGTRRDINNKDYFHTIEGGYFANEKEQGSKLEMSLNIPSERVDNYVLKNNGNLTFESVSQEWGLTFEGYSNGSAYGDLDNDGDLDLVVNNIDDPASVYENQQNENSFIRIAFKGPKGNFLGLDSKVTITVDNQVQFAENKTTRGFQSSSEPIVHFGLGQVEVVDKVEVTWFDGKSQVLESVASNQTIVLDYKNAQSGMDTSTTGDKLFQYADKDLNIDFKHKENEYDDFRTELLLPHATSQYGPGLAQGDLNGDGLEDFFIGGAKGQSGAVFLQNDNAGFDRMEIAALEADAGQEDIDALIFDANGDGLNDLYVVSGGNEFARGDKLLEDRLYLNQGGELVKSRMALPLVNSSGGRVKPCDFDNDGDIDLLVGGRMVPKSYPLPAKSFLLRNDSQNGRVVFTDVTNQLAPSLNNAGMVTDFVWTDFDKDGLKDLVIVGEWMPITFLHNNEGQFVNRTDEYGFENTVGWWYSIATIDANKDGNEDLIVGNLGLNYKYHASDEESFDVYLSDFDANGKRDIVLGYFQDGVQFPVRGRQCSSEQMPQIKNKFKDYNSFALASLKEVYTDEALSGSEVHYTAQTFASIMITNNGSGNFTKTNLPNETQLSTINSIVVEDIDEDGIDDLLLAGNLFVSEIETKRNDASIGNYLKGDGKGNFDVIPFAQSGFEASGDVRDMTILTTKKDRLVMIANNDDYLTVLKLN